MLKVLRDAAKKFESTNRQHSLMEEATSSAVADVVVVAGEP